MKRVRSEPRKNWRKTVSEEGLLWFDAMPERGNIPVRYWDESAHYRFSSSEIDAIEAATNGLHAMCLRAVQEVIDKKLYREFVIPDIAIPLIEKSWEQEPPSLYGRFDLAVNGPHSIKMLEYNADTPTSLLEAAVVQWTWFEQTKLGSDQFNSIHDKLVATWRDFSEWIRGRIAFTSVDSVEDGITLAYLQNTASTAGYDTESFPIREMGVSGGRFVSGNSTEYLTTIFKLYPWEWLVREDFSKYLDGGGVWIEPVWKMILSNKALLPLLWKLYPDHPYLLEATLEHPRNVSGWVRKPILGREGSNVEIFGKAVTGGDYGEDGYVYQRDAQIRAQDGQYAVVGSWIIGQASAGIGIRESSTPITDNLSRFVPHVIE